MDSKGKEIILMRTVARKAIVKKLCLIYLTGYSQELATEMF